MSKVEPCYKKLSKAIKHRRNSLQITNTKLATELGISRPALVNMLAGRQRIALHHVLKLEKILKTDLISELRK